MPYPAGAQTRTSPSPRPSSSAPPAAGAAPDPAATRARSAWWPIPASGPAQFDPIFQSTATADTSGGAGNYSIQVEDGGGNVLFTQHFSMAETAPEADMLGPQPGASFAELVPVTAGAGRIVLLDPTSAILAFVNLGGTPPTVAITNPTAGFNGTTPIAWTIADPNAIGYTTRHVVARSDDRGSIGETRLVEARSPARGTNRGQVAAQSVRRLIAERNRSISQPRQEKPRKAAIVHRR